MVALSELNTNLFDNLSKYITRYSYEGDKSRSQTPVKLLHNHDVLASSGISINTTNNDLNEGLTERTINKLIQYQKRLSNQEIDQIVEDYKSGLNIYQLAKQYRCHRTTISYHIKEQGIRMRNRPLSEAQIDEAVKLYESGSSCLKIGKIIGVDDTTILRRLRERGVKMRGVHERS